LTRKMAAPARHPSNTSPMAVLVFQFNSSNGCFQVAPIPRRVNRGTQEFCRAVRGPFLSSFVSFAGKSWVSLPPVEGATGLGDETVRHPQARFAFLGSFKGVCSGGRPGGGRRGRRGGGRRRWRSGCRWISGAGCRLLGVCRRCSLSNRRI